MLKNTYFSAYMRIIFACRALAKVAKRFDVQRYTRIALVRVAILALLLALIIRLFSHP